MNTRAWIVFPGRIRRVAAAAGPPHLRTPRPHAFLRHRLNWKRASMADVLGYHAADPQRGARLCFHPKPGSYDTTALIEVLEQMKVFYRGERVVLVWDGLSAHWSRAMRAWVAEQDWLTLERLPAYAPELNPVELLWSSLKKRELANFAGDHLADVADAADAPRHAGVRVVQLVPHRTAEQAQQQSADQGKSSGPHEGNPRSSRREMGAGPNGS
ncbi:MULTISPECIES: transposase [unclassified Streptomyces]|uniref:transposase n=1 Tax=unclassified Streptomyces TaxID=2593676 RepID=UPI0033B7665F